MKQLSSIEPPDEPRPLSNWLLPHPAFGIPPLDYLFNQMQGMYGTRWRVDYPDKWSIDNWRTTWADALDRAGLSLEQFMKGIEQCAEMYPRPPSTKEFLTACRIVIPAAHRNFPKLSRKPTEDEKEVGRHYIRICHQMIDEKMKEKERQRQERRL